MPPFISAQGIRIIATSDLPRILFLTRRYPPCIGGIETHCYELYSRLKTRRPVRLIALRRQSLLHLAWFLPFCVLATFWLLLLRRVDVVYFGDGVVGALAPLLRLFFRKTHFAVTIYGLEMTYRSSLARGAMVRGVRACDRVVVISENTRAITAAQGVPEDRLVVIYLGVEPLALAAQQEEALRKGFEAEYGIRFGQDRVLLNFGRQVPRKGVAQFLEKGMPLLEPDIKLLIGGKGPEVERIRSVREGFGLQDRVRILGPLAEDLLTMLRSSADLFLMPNIPMDTDVEGFGQTQLECMHAGTPVVAFAVDALVESVREGGYLVEPGDYLGFAAAIHAFYALSPAERQAKRQEAREYVRREYSWERTTDLYIEVFEGRR